MAMYSKNVVDVMASSELRQITQRRFISALNSRGFRLCWLGTIT